MGSGVAHQGKVVIVSLSWSRREVEEVGYPVSVRFVGWRVLVV